MEGDYRYRTFRFEVTCLVIDKTHRFPLSNLVGSQKRECVAVSGVLETNDCRDVGIQCCAVISVLENKTSWEEPLATPHGHESCIMTCLSADGSRAAGQPASCGVIRLAVGSQRQQITGGRWCGMVSDARADGCVSSCVLAASSGEE